MASVTKTGVKTTAVQTPDADNLVVVARQLKEIVEVAQRLRGDPNDSFVRVSELVKTGLVRLVNGTIQPPASNTAPGTLVPSSRKVLGGTSLTGGGDLTADRTLTLVNDNASPGNNKVYGTSGAGVKGWFAATGGATSPLTTKGDIWVFGVADTRLPIGSNTQVLTADSTQATGMKWAAGGVSMLYGQVNFVTPPAGGWTWLNQGTSAVATVYTNALKLTAAPTSGNETLYVQTVVAGTFTVTACLMISGYSIPNLSRAGLYWRDAGTGHMQCFVIDMRASPVPLAQYNFSNLTTFNATIWSAQVPTFPRQFMSIPVWLRVKRDGGNNILCYISDNGVDFVQVSTTDATNYVAAPTQIGVGFTNNAASGSSYVVELYSFAVGP